ncbi:MAG: mechanosensitive ion channel family protein [Blastocatellia bacterium]|nr:mechanosensitive ion channel family protein [Blastocatellia bacterium]
MRSAKLHMNLTLLLMAGSFFGRMPVWERFWLVYDNLTGRVMAHVPQIVCSLAIVALTLLLSRSIRKTILLAMERTKADANIRMLVAQSGYVSVWVIGVVAALSILDVNMSGFVAGLGLTGAAVGFALREIIANFVAGIILLSIRPFRIGDTVIIEGTEGTVENIEIRVTTLKTGEGRQVLIPNGKVFTANITNLTAYAERRGAFFIKVAAYHKPEAVCQLLQKEVQAVAGVLAQPPAAVRLQEFSADALTVEISFWVNAQTSVFPSVLQTVKERTRSCLLTNKINLA